MSDPSLVAPAISPRQRLVDELRFLQEYPDFCERPATLEEFLGPNYLNIRKTVRPRILEELRVILGDKVSAERPAAYELALITGAIGIGKTTIASILLPYLAHWALCLRNPQEHFEMLSGSRIAFMMMSTSEKQAREVLFGDVKARINGSPWFRAHPYDPTFKNQLRFEKDIWIVPGDSTETAFEGYNILGGIIDEGDSHKQTRDRDYAQVGYDAISSRITSRFGDRGFLMIIGQMKRSVGFMAQKFQEFTDNPKAYAVRLTIWESRGDDYYRDKNGVVEKFWFDPARKMVINDELASAIGTSGLLRIPELYRRQFVTHPQKALRDLAGIPPLVGDPFISLTHKIAEARDRWIEHHGDVSPVDKSGHVEPWFKARDALRRTAHLDIAYASGGDSLGFAMGHVPRMVEIDGERKPYIVIDLLMRVTAPAGGEIFLGDIRRFIYELRSKWGYKLSKITYDGFQSTDTRQQLERRRFETEYVSIDREVLPYHDLREAIYEDRIEFPPYICEVTNGNGLTEDVEILMKELSELSETGTKVDHPLKGSKDVADAVAGVTFTLMGDRSLQRKVISLEQRREERGTRIAASQMQHPAYRGEDGLRAPLPPVLQGG